MVTCDFWYSKKQRKIMDIHIDIDSPKKHTVEIEKKFWIFTFKRRVEYTECCDVENRLINMPQAYGNWDDYTYLGEADISKIKVEN